MASVLSVNKESKSWEGMPLWSVTIVLKCCGHIETGKTYRVPAWTEKAAIAEAFRLWAPEFGHL